MGCEFPECTCSQWESIKPLKMYKNQKCVSLVVHSPQKGEKNLSPVDQSTSPVIAFTHLKG